MIRLNLGCKDTRIKGFKNVDIEKRKNVDYVCNVNNLNIFKDKSVDEVYASHILEHFSWKLEVDAVLREWYRVLKDGGILWVAVPDFNKVIEAYKSFGFLSDDMQAFLYGSMETEYYAHKIMFNFEYLMAKLYKAGFKYVEKIGDMPYGCIDASTIGYHVFGIRMSLNMKAIK